MEKIEQLYELYIEDFALPKHIRNAVDDLDGDVIIFMNKNGTKWACATFYTEDVLDINGNVIETHRYGMDGKKLPDINDSVSMQSVNLPISNAKWDTIREFARDHLALDLSWLDESPKIKICTCGGAKTSGTHSSWCDFV